ncbi:hypothetical protein C5C37_14325 [Rathayibacter sp. AY1F9]|nr:hypothetical protein C5C37_14325 [Rathayibacter sp. AY1F9]
MPSSAVRFPAAAPTQRCPPGSAVAVSPRVASIAAGSTFTARIPSWHSRQTPVNPGSGSE